MASEASNRRYSADENYDVNQAIRERAYQIWLDEGRPEGRAEAHWDMASELVAIHESYRQTLLPNPAAQLAERPFAEPIEEAALQQNLGEFPTLADQGEESTFPDRPRMDANEVPPAPPRKRKTSRRSN